MNKERLLTFLVIALTLLNIGILGFFFLRPMSHDLPPPRNGGQMNEDRRGERREKMLGFDDQQTKLFKISQNEHKSQMRTMRESLQRLSAKYYHLSSQESDEVNRLQLLDEINEVTNQIYESNLAHFDDIRKISNEDQKIEVERFIDGLLRNNRKNGPRQKGPPK